MTEAEEDEVVRSTIEQCARIADAAAAGYDGCDFSAADTIPGVAYELGRHDEARTLATALRHVMQERSRS